MDETDQIEIAMAVLSELHKERAQWLSQRPLDSWQESLRREFVRHMTTAGIEEERAVRDLAAEMSAVEDAVSFLEHMVVEARTIERLGLVEAVRSGLDADQAT